MSTSRQKADTIGIAPLWSIFSTQRDGTDDRMTTHERLG